MGWCIVKFLSDKLVEVVCEKWLQNNSTMCMFPPSNYLKKYINLLKNEVDPEDDWKLYKIQVLGSYGTLSRAIEKLKMAQWKSDLESTDDEKRGRGFRHKKKSQLYHSEPNSTDDDEDFNEYPSSPHLTETSIVSKEIEGRHEYVPLMKENSNESFSFQKEIKHSDLKASSSKETHIQKQDSPGPNKINHNPPLKEKINILQNVTVTPATDFESQVLRCLNLLNLKCDQLSETLDVISRSLTQKAGRNMQPRRKLEIVELFPLQNEEALGELEIWLKKEEENPQLLVVELSKLGGGTVKEATRTLMYHCFSNALGMKFTWEGAGQKKTFKTLNLVSVFFAAVRENMSSATNSDIIAVIKSWLLRAKERDSNKTNKPHMHEK